MPPDPQWVPPTLKAHGPQESRESEVVIRVEVCDENVIRGETHAVSHHLTLSPFPAVEKKHPSLSVERERRDVSGHGGPRRCGSEKRQAKDGSTPSGAKRVDGNCRGEATRGIISVNQPEGPVPLTVGELRR